MKKIIILLGISILYLSQAVFCLNTEQILQNEITNFSLDSVNIYQAAQLLMKSSKLKICVEERPFNPETDKEWFETHSAKPYYDLKKNKVSIHLKKSTPKDILDKITSDKDEYKWDIDKTTGVINIIPKKSPSILDFEVPPFSANTSLRDICFSLDSGENLRYSLERLFKEHNIHILVASIGNRTDIIDILQKHQIINTTKPSTMREILNLLVYNSDSRLIWHISGFQGEPTLAFGIVYGDDE